jgi:hypothetical protein
LRRRTRSLRWHQLPCTGWGVCSHHPRMHHVSSTTHHTHARARARAMMQQQQQQQLIEALIEAPWLANSGHGA